MKSNRISIEQQYHRLGLFAAVLGLCCYLALSWNYAHHLTTTVWDESGYLYKGYLFASGQYQPFADYAPWTNQLPLAFLIPGYIQHWFGPGMAAARVSAVVIGGLSLVGLWLVAYRLGGVWWGAGVVWTIALNSGWVKVFSQVYSQGLVCLFFAWMLVFAVGEKRKRWELCLAAFLAGLAGMTRINVLPVLFIYIIFLIWQSGWKTAAWAAICGLLPVIGLHFLYWPGVLKIWAYWLPADIFPLIAQYQSPWREVFLPPEFSWWPLSAWWGDRDHLAWFGLETLWESLRANLVPFLGVLLCIFCWPRKGKWISDYHRKLAIFLLGVYLSMLVIHLWAALGGNTCQFSCLVGYLIFFNWFGLILVVVIGVSWQSQVLQNQKRVVRNFIYLVLGASVILSPAPYFVRGLNSLTCGQDVVASHEGVGVQLRMTIPPGSTVFWDVKSDMLLLYMPEVEIFLPQANFRFTLVNDPQADPDQLQRFGWWNHELGEEWIGQADYIVVEQRFYDGLWGWNQRVFQGQFEIILRSAPPESCRQGISNVVVLKPIKSGE